MNKHRNFFLHLAAFITLYWAMIALLVIFFQLINHVLPDPLSYGGSISELIRWGLSGVIVAFPVFAGIMFFFRKKEIKRPSFPIYFTLFVAAITAVVDIAVLIYNFTGGEVTTRFLLKVLAVLVVTGAVFGFEMWNLKRESFKLDIRSRLLIALAYILVLAAVVLGFVVVGSPGSQRAMQLDMDRVSDLSSLQYEILNHYDREGALPENLNEFRGSQTNDPRTDEGYEYRVVDKDTFELCATFETSSEDLDEDTMYYKGIYSDSTWSHEAERTCFERDVVKDGDFPRIR